jgi:hypothetical protein
MTIRCCVAYHNDLDKKILFKKQLFDLEVKGQGPTKVITVCDTPPHGHAHTNYLSINSFVGFI